MGLTSRFITYHVFGYPSSRGYSFGFDGRDAYLRARGFLVDPAPTDSINPPVL